VKTRLIILHRAALARQNESIEAQLEVYFDQSGAHHRA